MVQKYEKIKKEYEKLDFKYTELRVIKRLEYNRLNYKIKIL